MTKLVLIASLAYIQISVAAFSQQVTLTVKDNQLSEVMRKLEKQTGYQFLFRSQLKDKPASVTVDLHHVPLREALDVIFRSQPFSYTIENNMILIGLEKKSNPRATSDYLPAGVLMQQRFVTGTVTGEDGAPLPGVNIRIRNTNFSTVTDEKGIYRIRVRDEDNILIFSYMGHSQNEIRVGSREVINVSMKSVASDLTEVVVVGYGEVRRQDLTGSVASVDMSDFEKAPVTSFDEALAGRVAGVNVAGNDGQPGAMNNITIRGIGSITQNTSPLYVIDGFPLELEEDDNSFISPEDIESIDILKDASATAIYGARGSNGVIIITTKSGRKSDPVITFSPSFGLSRFTKQMDMMSPYEFVRYQLELRPEQAARTYTPGELPEDDPYYEAGGNTLEGYRNTAGLNLQEQIMQSGTMQNYDLSVRGGSDRTTYSLSGNIRDQQGIIVNSGIKRYQGRFRLDQQLRKNLKVGTNINLSHNKNYGTVLSGDASNNPSLSLMYSVWGFRPVTGSIDLDLLDELIDPDISGDDYRVNPVISTRNELRHTLQNSIYANVYAEYDLSKKLKLRISGGVTNRSRVRENFHNSLTRSGNPRNTGRGVNGRFYYSPRNSWLNENTLTYRDTFNKHHKLTVVGGYTIQQNSNATRGFSNSLVPNESLGIDGLDEAQNQVTTSRSSMNGIASFLGRANYDYRGRYLLTASFRADGSSKFARDNRWGFFPSAAFAWRISKENFMKDVTAVSDAKFRASYGATGNNRVSDFSYLSTVSFPNGGGYSFNNGTPIKGAAINYIGNPDLLWESAVQADLGFDIGLFNNRIQVTTDVYSRKTENLLLNTDLPYTTGVTSAFLNVGSIQNRGLEVTLNTVNVRNSIFSWSSNFNISFNDNKILSLAESQNAIFRQVSFNAAYGGTFPYISMLGQPIGQFYGLIWDGVYQLEDFEVTGTGYLLNSNIPTNGDARTSIQPGYIKYRDLNDDGIINTSDYTVVGRGVPIHTGGFTNNFSYRRFDLNVLLQWSYGNDIINANRLQFEGGSSRYALNQFASYVDRWSIDNQNSLNNVAPGSGPANFSSRVVEDGSYLRLKTVSLGYNIPASLIGRAGINRLRVHFSAQNLLTWTSYSGPDPEVSVRHSALTPGFDYAAYPRAKVMTMGINMTL